jgi:membrane protein
MRSHLDRVMRWGLRTFGTFIDRLVSVGVIQSGIVLAAQTFLALFPLLIAIVALLPVAISNAISASLRSRVGISGSTDRMVSELLVSRDNLHGGITAIGVIVVLASATAFTRALQRVYERSWMLPTLGLRGSIRGLMWLVGLVGFLWLIGTAIRYAGTGPASTVVRAALVITSAVVLWWLTPYVLLGGRVRLRSLLPCGLITATAMLALGVVSAAVVPRTIRSNEQKFGTIGVVFALESWLVIVGCTIVAASVVGAVLAQTSGPIGQLARGRADLDAWRRVPGTHNRRLASTT